MVLGADPAQMLPLPAMATDVPNVIPIDNGDTHPNVTVANGGETQEPIFDQSPIREIKDRPDNFALTDLTELSHEDDEMIALQLERAQNREEILSRKIELKRRRVQNESKASSSHGFNLTRELSLEMDRAKSEEAQRKIQMLEQEKHQIVLDSNQRIEHEKQQVVQWAKDHIEVMKEDFHFKTLQEVEAMKVHWQEHFRNLMHTELQATMREESQKQQAIIGSFVLRH